MKSAKKAETPCANEGCGRAAEEGSRLCAECSLEWSLFHREARRPEPRLPENPRIESAR